VLPTPEGATAAVVRKELQDFGYVVISDQTAPPLGGALLRVAHLSASGYSSIFTKKRDPSDGSDPAEAARIPPSKPAAIPESGYREEWKFDGSWHHYLLGVRQQPNAQTATRAMAMIDDSEPDTSAALQSLVAVVREMLGDAKLKGFDPCYLKNHPAIGAGGKVGKGSYQVPAQDFHHDLSTDFMKHRAGFSLIGERAHARAGVPAGHPLEHVSRQTFT